MCERGAVVGEVSVLLWNVEDVLLLRLVHYLVGVVPPVHGGLCALLAGQPDSVVEGEDEILADVPGEEESLPLAGVPAPPHPHHGLLVGVGQQRPAADAVSGGEVEAVGGGGLCREAEAEQVVPPHNVRHAGGHRTDHPAPPEGAV